MANSNDASVGTEPAGTTDCGRKIAAMEKPLATRTLIAVTSEASRIALIVVIDFAFTETKGPFVQSNTQEVY
jgi:hypothetical protein